MNILLNPQQSDTGKALSEIMANLQTRSEIDLALLSTDDGIPLQRISDLDSKMGAVAGFILAAARQGFTMLDLRSSQEIVIRNDQEQLFVSKIFPIHESCLVLTILFKRDVAYKRLFNQAIKSIVATVEK